MPVFYITVAMSKWLTVTCGGQIIQTVRISQDIQSSHRGHEQIISSQGRVESKGPDVV